MHQPFARPRARPLIAGLLAAGSTVILAAVPAVAADQAVTIADFAFSPPAVTITVGDTVTWTNSDAVVHTATATDGSWDTGDLAQGQSGAITFSTAGTFAYLCTPHPTMTGTVVVQAAAGGGGGGGGGGGAPTTPPTDTAVVAETTDAALGPAVLALLGTVALAILVPRRRTTGRE
ncbi:MAG TPA: cupredoxin family copper-binding protein [Candidatus Limnocylindrales bacterium]|nr:cupredoxin family copper-binding protein [Candidatus Limnocylindrales bacterium]